MIWLDSITISMDMNLSKLWGTVENTEAWHTTVQGVTRVGHHLETKQQYAILHGIETTALGDGG